MSLEYEIEKIFEKVKKSINFQKSSVLRNFMSTYLPVISMPVYSEDEDEEETKSVVDSVYLNDLYKSSDMVGSAS